MAQGPGPCSQQSPHCGARLVCFHPCSAGWNFGIDGYRRPRAASGHGSHWSCPRPHIFCEAPTDTTACDCSDQIQPRPFGGPGNGLPEAARLDREGAKIQLGSPLLGPEMIRRSQSSWQTLPMCALEWHFYVFQGLWALKMSALAVPQSPESVNISPHVGKKISAHSPGLVT